MKVRISDYYTRIEKMKINQTFKNQFGYRLGEFISLKDFDLIIKVFNSKYQNTKDTKYINAVINWKKKKLDFIKEFNSRTLIDLK